MKTPNVEGKPPFALADHTEMPIDGVNEELFLTPNVDDQQVTKRGGIDATNEEEGSIPEFDKIINVDAIIYGGLLYPFNQSLPETTTKETNTKEVV